MVDVHIHYDINPPHFHPIFDYVTYLHAATLNQRIIEWLDANCETWILYTDITWGDVVGNRKAALWDHLVVRFSKAEDAILFKLTWL